MATPLSLDTGHAPDGTPVVIAAGEIDLSNVATFTRAISAAGNGASMTIDLSAVRYLDSAGINALFNHADEIDHLHVIVHPVLVRVLQVSGLGDVATVEAAAAPPRADGAN